MSGNFRTLQIHSGSAADQLASLDDGALACEARCNPAAFDLLFDRFFNQVYWYAYGRLHDHMLAEDAASLIFEKVHNSLTRFDPERGAFRSWLFRICQNVVIDLARARQRSVPRSLQLLPTMPDTHLSPEENFLREERRSDFLRVMQQLSEREREVIELRLAGLDGNEIAAMIGRSRSAVDSAACRGMAHLRELMAAEPSMEVHRGA